MKPVEIYKGKPGEPVVEGTTLGWIIHGGDLANDERMYCRDVSNYQMLYSLDVLGVEDRGEDDQLDLHRIQRDHCSRQGRTVPSQRSVDTWCPT
jgi:gentisate 1,2-dioxygenase